MRFLLRDACKRIVTIGYRLVFQSYYLMSLIYVPMKQLRISLTHSGNQCTILIIRLNAFEFIRDNLCCFQH
uniref:Ovule protein n=1 Tax=Parascaris equorum TaxID=6256 RepID=A0A914S836_PAREQ